MSQKHQLAKRQQQPAAEQPTPELVTITHEMVQLNRKIEEFNTAKATIYEELAQKAQAVYAPQLNHLFEQMQALLVTDQQLRQLEVDVLLELKRVLAKY